jgi:hypothetical protein
VSNSIEALKILATRATQVDEDMLGGTGTVVLRKEHTQSTCKIHFRVSFDKKKNYIIIKIKVAVRRVWRSII